MVKAFSVASWNVRHFKKKRGEPIDAARVERVTSFLKLQNPDVFAIYEVTGQEVFTEMVNKFPGYDFMITEGPQTQEILLGARARTHNRSTLTCFATQRVQFKSGVTLMRPGVLATINVDGVNYSLLFLHLASSTFPRGMGLRDDMLYRAVKFRHVLDKAYGDRHTANYIFMGDLNIMGMEYPFDKDIEAQKELDKWDLRARQYYGMRKLAKTFDFTWWGGSKSDLDPSDLDHVFAAKHLKFKSFKNAKGENVEVDVRGWVNESSTSAQDDWINDYSDHSLLYFELQKLT